jgi:putative ABC transport system permease protein
MALGVGMFSTGFNVRHSLSVLLQQTSNTMRYDVKVVLKDAYQADRLIPIFNSVDNIASIETWVGGKGVLQSQSAMADSGIGLVALPYDTELRQPAISAGRWLSGNLASEVVMNSRAWRAYGKPALGKPLNISIAGHNLAVTLVGLLQEFDTAKMYFDQDFYDAAVNPLHKVNSAMIAAKHKDFDSVLTLKNAIEKRIAESDLNVMYVESQQQRVKILYDHLDMILISFLVFALIVLSVSALGMASAMGINVIERTREIGVLRAIGATPAMIQQLFLSEGLLVGGAAIVLGLILAWPLSLMSADFWGNLIMGGAKLPAHISVSGVLITIATTLIFTWFASRMPARNAIRLSTREALSYE